MSESPAWLVLSDPVWFLVRWPFSLYRSNKRPISTGDGHMGGINLLPPAGEPCDPRHCPPSLMPIQLPVPGLTANSGGDGRIASLQPQSPTRAGGRSCPHSHEACRSQAFSSQT